MFFVVAKRIIKVNIYVYRFSGKFEFSDLWNPILKA